MWAVTHSTITEAGSRGWPKTLVFTQLYHTMITPLTPMLDEDSLYSIFITFEKCT
jgi:hypothetical protein